ncbi:MAG: SGNH/GDSL hydrolase family protein [Casimicrobiaceae bacterium]
MLNSDRAGILRACLVAAAVIGCFLVAELATRVVLFGYDTLVHPTHYSPRSNTLTNLVIPNADPVLTYRLNPGIDGYFKGKPFSVNANGFRGQVLATAKPPGVFRIASLGASVTMGSGVTDAEVYSAQLAQLLEAQSPGRFEVINAAVGGYSATQIFALYDQDVAKYKPDLILFPVFYSGYQALDDGVPATYAPLASWFPAWTDLRGYLLDSFLYQGLRDSARTWLNPLLSVDWLVRGRPVAARQETTSDALTRFVAQRNAEGIPVCLLALHRINEEPPDTDAVYRQRLETWVRGHPGSCLIDTIPGLRGKIAGSDRIYWGDNHPNARVHRLYAEEIARLLAASKLAP